MSLATYGAPYNNLVQNNATAIERKKHQQPNKQLSSKKVTDLFQSIHNNTEEANETNDYVAHMQSSDMYDNSSQIFSQQSQSQPQNLTESTLITNLKTDNWVMPQAQISQSSPQQSQMTYSQTATDNDKLNYIIHLLEEQQDEKTQTSTENVILYGFLGVFMIFVVDSFNKAGKYVR